MKVVALDGLDQQAQDVLKGISQVQLEVLKDPTPEQKMSMAKAADVVLIRSATRITREFLNETPRLKVVVRAGIGLDNVDVTAATERGVIVMNTPLGNRITTAEHTIALMMSLLRFIPQATMSMKQGKWEKKAFTGRELCRKTLGLVGLGNIGGIVADRALHMGMKVLAYDPFISDDHALKLGVEKVSLDELFSRAEIISVHVPLTDQTRHLINESAFEKMRKGVYLIQCSRGGTVKEKALLAALESGKVAGAALDVFEEEPVSSTDPLVLHPKVICTPHLGAATTEAQLAVSLEAVELITDYAVNGNIRNAVNHPNINEARLKMMAPLLELAETMGSFLGQWVFGEKVTVKKVELKFQNTESSDQGILTLAYLKGFLEPIAGENVNFVNARSVAQSHDISVVESSGHLSTDFVQLMQATVHRESGEPLTLTGTLFGKVEPRFVGVNHFKTDAHPAGWVLVTINKDVPRMVGTIGSILGEDGVNIAAMNLGRGPGPSKLAFAMTNVDSEIPAATLEKLRKTPGIEMVKLFLIEGTFKGTSL